MVLRFFTTTQIVACASLLLQDVQADCYSHNGVLARDSDTYTSNNGYLELLPCGRQSNPEMANNCCLFSEKCGSNGLCLDTKGIYKRQYCFDKDWNKCSQLALTYDDAGLVVYNCDTNIFCYGNSNCCDNGGDRYYVDPNNGTVTKTSTAALKEDAIWWDVASIPIFRSLQVSTVSSIVPTAIQTLGSVTASATPTSSETGSSSNSNTDLSDCPSQGLSGGAGVGIGIGASAAVAGLAALAFFFFSKRKHSAQAQPVPLHTEPPKDPYNAGGYYSGGPTTYTYQDVPRQSPPREEYELQHERPRHELS